MSVPNPSPLSTVTKLALIRSIEDRRASSTSESDDSAPPATPIKPYEVRIREGVGGTVFVVGHDRSGSPMVELRVQRRHLAPSMIRRMERWCRDHDDAALALI